jgi:hypothetical protein
MVKDQMSSLPYPPLKQFGICNNTSAVRPEAPAVPCGDCNSYIGTLTGNSTVEEARFARDGSKASPAKPALTNK